MLHRQRECFAGDFLITSIVEESRKTIATSHAEDVLRHAHTHTTLRDVCYHLWHMVLIYLSLVMCCTTLYSSALIFPMASRFVCMCQLGAFMCVLLRGQPGCLLVPQSKGSQLLLKQFHCVFCSVSTTAWDFRSQTHMLSPEQWCSSHTKPPVGNDNLIIFWLTWPVWFFFWTLFWNLILHTVLIHYCLLMYSIF